MDLMSTAQLLGNFGEFFGAIAVVATLVYLAFQIRQNTLALKTSSLRTTKSQMIATNTLTVHVWRSVLPPRTHLRAPAGV